VRVDPGRPGWSTSSTIFREATRLAGPRDAAVLVRGRSPKCAIRIAPGTRRQEAYGTSKPLLGGLFDIDSIAQLLGRCVTARRGPTFSIRTGGKMLRPDRRLPA